MKGYAKLRLIVSVSSVIIVIIIISSFDQVKNRIILTSIKQRHNKNVEGGHATSSRAVQWIWLNWLSIWLQIKGNRVLIEPAQYPYFLI